MKRLLAIFLLGSIMLQSFNKVIIIIHWELNKDYIAKNLCENKDKPAMHCCGKCQLKKKLAEDNEKQKLPVFPDDKSDIQLFGSPVSIHLNANQNDVLSIISPYLQTLQSGVHISVFHPPCA